MAKRIADPNRFGNALASDLKPAVLVRLHLPDRGNPDAATSKDFSVARFARCMGPDGPVGALRISLGYPTVAADLDRALDLIHEVAAGRAAA